MAAQKYAKVVTTGKANVQDAAYEPMRSKQTREAKDREVMSQGMNGDQDAPSKSATV